MTQNSRKLPREKFEEQEFGKGKKGYTLCTGCGAVYYEKSWHHKEKYADKMEEIEKEAKKSICPACAREKDNLCEGFVTLKNVPEDKKEELLNLIKNAGERAIRNDILSRVTKIEERDGNIEICTTENQLAVSLGKQIKSAFEGELDINFSAQGGPARVVWAYPEK